MDLDYLGSIERDSAGFAEAVVEAGPDKLVTGCPGWTVRDLAAHLHEVHDFWRTIVEGRLQDPSQVPEELDQSEDFGELLGAFRKGAAGLVASLRGADPGEPVWTWASQKDVAFVSRHQAQEAAVHRWDAEAAAGREFAIDTAIAADAVDEFLEFSTPSRMKGAVALSGSVHMHPTDADGEWMLSERDDGSLEVERAHGKGDAALRATASDLLLILYRRVPIDVGQVFGDRTVLERLVARTDLT
ncbi:MAG TPA: maleylpyruvate isomerase family mycothiol-dependent enzyme [Acidimicrobiia bacterium]|jgi:uncharacterized protein (TIGR03083 family)|nr:maleylpyruvate isomerase family mycothiol-dependent enzyme [Acidimicrobiia bacterium]